MMFGFIKTTLILSYYISMSSLRFVYPFEILTVCFLNGVFLENKTIN